MKMPTTSCGSADLALNQHGFDMRARRAVMIAEHHRVFEKFAAVGHLLELRLAQKLVLAPVHFARARRARGRRHGERHVVVGFEQLARQSGFAGARGARQHEHQAAARDMLIQHWRPAP
jgi:hypothetical protein